MNFIWLPENQQKEKKRKNSSELNKQTKKEQKKNHSTNFGYLPRPMHFKFVASPIPLGIEPRKLLKAATRTNGQNNEENIGKEVRITKVRSMPFPVLIVPGKSG